MRVFDLNSRTVTRRSRGGYSLRRVVPQKVRPIADQSLVEESLTDPSRSGMSGGKRRTRTSVAMIGLALSMGASGLLLPRHDDRALAAEPRAAEAEAAPTPPVDGVNMAPNVSQSSQSAQNSRRISNSNLTEFSSSESSSYVPAKPSVHTAPEAVRGQDASLERMRYQRDRLRESLSQVSSFQEPEVRVQSSEVPKAIAPNTLSDSAESNFVGGTATYHVQPGDTIGSIARVYGISQEALIRLNGLSDPHFLRVNQALMVPRFSRATAQIPSEAAVAAESIRPAAHTQDGALTPEPVAVVSAVPAVSEAPAPSEVLVYRVDAGDTVAAIARTYGVSRESLVSANRLSDPNFIRVGQELRIPGVSTQPVAEAPVNQAPVNQSKDADAEAIQAVDVAMAAPVAPEPEAPMLADAALPEAEAVVATAMFSTDFISPVVALPETSETAVEASPAPARSEATDIERLVKENVYASRLLEEVAELQGGDLGDRSEAIAIPDQPALVAAAPQSDVLDSNALDRLTPRYSRPGVVTPPAGDVAEPIGLSAAELEARATERKVDTVADGIIEAEQPQLMAAEPTVSRSFAESTETGSVVEVEQPQLVAAAPVGSESYAPLLEPVAGRMVSPELPPLPAADAFLPEGSSVFDGYIWPARGVLTSGFGPRWGRMHRGIDIAAPVGTPIYAAAPGVVEFAGWNSGGYGYMVDIRHPDGSMTRYAHNSRLLVSRGQDVGQGDQISEMGSTGYSTGPHLHFEIHVPSRGAVNPSTLLASR